MKQYNPNGKGELERLKRLFRLKDWDIAIVEGDDSGTDCCGHCLSRPEYKDARVTYFPEKIESTRKTHPSEPVKATVYHELGEVIAADCTAHRENSESPEMMRARDLKADYVRRIIEGLEAEKS